MIRLYDIPDNTFDSETEDAEDDDGQQNMAINEITKLFIHLSDSLNLFL